MSERQIPCLIDPRVECSSDCALSTVASAKLTYAEHMRNYDEDGVIIADLTNVTLFEQAQILTKNIRKLDMSNQLRKCQEFAIHESSE